MTNSSPFFTRIPYVFFIFLLLFNSPVLFAQAVNSVIDSSGLTINDGLVYDGNHYYYGSSFTEGSVYKFDLAGNVALFASGLETANGLLMARDGRLMVADPDGNRIVVYDTANGSSVDTITMTSPADMVYMGNTDTLLVTDWRSNKIYKLAPDGSFTDFITNSLLDGPVGICYLPDLDTYYINNFNNRVIYRIDGNQLNYVATVPAPNTPGNKWLGFITCSNSMLYGTSFNAHQIYEINPNYVDSVTLLTGIAGQPGHTNGSLDSATFNQPNGILAISDDSILVSEFVGGIVRLITTSQNPSTGFSTLRASGKSITLFPNPAKNAIRATFNDINHDLRSARFFDLSGSTFTLSYSIIDALTVEFNTAALNPGIYFLSVSGHETTKLVIR